MNKDWGWKLLAVLLAILLWLYVTSTDNPLITYDIKNIPVTLKNENAVQQAGLVVYNKNNAKYKVGITVRGRRNDILTLNSSSLIAQIDLSNFKGKGENTFQPEIFGLPNYIQFIKQNPSDIKLYLDTYIREKLKVYVRIAGMPKKDYTYISPVIKPDTVYVKGPQSLLKTIDSVMVKVNIDGRGDTMNASYPIQLMDKSGKEIRDIEFSPQNVDVTVPIYKKKDVPVEVVTNGKLPDSYKLVNIAADPPYVTIAASDDILSKINSLNTYPVNLSNATSSKTENVSLDIPDGVYMVNDANKVNVNINIQKIIRKSVTVKNIMIRSSDGKKGAITTPSATITLEGAEDAINKLKDSDIILYVDITGLDSGKHKVPVKAEVPNSVKNLGISPASMDVNVQ